MVASRSWSQVPFAWGSKEGTYSGGICWGGTREWGVMMVNGGVKLGKSEEKGCEIKKENVDEWSGI